jgi:hypothetical protein
MPSLWRRLSNFINERILEREEDEPYVPPPEDLGGGIIDEPPEPPDQPDGTVGPNDQVTLTDDFGNYVGTHDWYDWYDETLRGRISFRMVYGYSITTRILISLLEEAYGIEWDWESWRRDYDAIHG